MKTFRATLQSSAPYSQSKFYKVDRLEREQNDAYEERTWAERLHYDAVTQEVFIPPMAWKNCLSEAAKYLSMPIKGKGKTTYTKHIESGILVVDRTMLGVKKADVRGDWQFVPADGKRGSGKRVMKCFPVIDSWDATVDFMVFDEIVTMPVFREHLKTAGDFIGIGRFRPRNNGYYGRFLIVDVQEV